MASPIATPKPTPHTWTLRLKSQKTTVLLHVDPLHTFSTIKTHLLHALSETELRHATTGAALPLPKRAELIVLGRPVDVNETGLGFMVGEWEEGDGGVEDDDGEDDEDGFVVVDGGKGKAKAKAKVKRGRPKAVDSVKDCPKGAGLRDGAVLAFRWRDKDGLGWVGEDEEEDEGLGIEEDGEKADMWGVKLAKYEDAYGVENEMDVGGGREFEG